MNSEGRLQSGLLTRTATENVSLRADEKLTAFVELQRGDSRVRGKFDLIMAEQKQTRELKAHGVLELESAVRAS